VIFLRRRNRRQDEKTSCEGDALEVSTRELAEYLEKAAEGPRRKRRLPENQDIARLRGGPPPSYAWEDLTRRSRNGTLGELTLNEFGNALLFYLLAPVLVTLIVWSVLYMAGSEPKEEANGQVYMDSFFDSLGRWAVTPGNSLLAYIALGVTALTLLAAVVNLNPNEARARAESVQRYVGRFVDLMPVTITGCGSQQSLGWRVRLLDLNTMTLIGAGALPAHDRVLVTNRVIRWSFLGLLSSIGVLLAPTIAISLREHSNNGWLVGVFGFLLVAHVAALVDFLGEGFKLDRAVYRSGAILAQWSLARVALAASAEATVQTADGDRARVSSALPRFRASNTRSLVPAGRRVVRLMLSLSALGLVWIIVRSGMNDSVGSGARLVLGTMLWCLVFLALCRWFTFQMQLRRVNVRLSPLAKFSRFDAATSLLVSFWSVLFWTLISLITLPNIGNPSSRLWLGVCIACALAFCPSLMKVVGPKMLHSASPSLAYSLWQINGDEFVIQEIQRRIELSLDQLTEIRDGADFEESRSTEGVEGYHSADRAKKRTADSGREFIVYKGDIVPDDQPDQGTPSRQTAES